MAIELKHRKADVMILDTDPQKIAINWIDRRNLLAESTKAAKYPIIHGVSKDGNVRKAIQGLCIRYDVITVDASGRDSKSLRTGLTIADIFICSLKLNQAGLETLPHVCDLIEAAKSLNPSLKSFCILSSRS